MIILSNFGTKLWFDSAQIIVPQSSCFLSRYPFNVQRSTSTSSTLANPQRLDSFSSKGRFRTSQGCGCSDTLTILHRIRACRYVPFLLVMVTWAIHSRVCLDELAHTALLRLRKCDRKRRFEGFFVELCLRTYVVTSSLGA